METISYRVEYVQEDLWYLIGDAEGLMAADRCSVESSANVLSTVQIRLMVPSRLVPHKKAGNCTLRRIVS
jgi:hypothetical protein